MNYNATNIITMIRVIVQRIWRLMASILPCSIAKLEREFGRIRIQMENGEKHLAYQEKMVKYALDKITEVKTTIDTVKKVYGAQYQAHGQMLDKLMIIAQLMAEAIKEQKGSNADNAAKVFMAIESNAGSLRRQIRGAVSKEEANFIRMGELLVDNTKATIRTLNDMRTLYYNPKEVQSMEARGLCVFTSRPDFAQEYAALVFGLPEESKVIINRILCRLQLIKGLRGRIDLFSVKEKEALREIDEFSREILSITETIHCWHNYYLPVNHFSPNVFLYRYGMDLIRDKEYLRKKAIMDVGAYIGDSALILSEYTDNRVYCFEPSCTNYAYLLTTIRLNDLTHVIPVNAALGASEGEFLLRESGDRSSSDVRMVPNPQAIERCQMLTLDAYVNQHRIEVGLIKVDIEGAEQEFLRGAVQTIREQRPTLLISIYHNADDFLKIKPMIEKMDAGYVFRIYHPSIKSVRNETLLVCEQPRQQ